MNRLFQSNIYNFKLHDDLQNTFLQSMPHIMYKQSIVLKLEEGEC